MALLAASVELACVMQRQLLVGRADVAAVDHGFALRLLAEHLPDPVLRPCSVCCSIGHARSVLRTSVAHHFRHLAFALLSRWVYRRRISNYAALRHQNT